MAEWSFPPQSVAVETVTADVRGSGPGARTDVVGRVSENFVHIFRLRYEVTSDVANMEAFFVARRGGFEAFSFVNPVDARRYQVRFESGLSLSGFLAGYHATGEIVFVATADADGESYSEGGYGGGAWGGGTFG